MPGPRAVDLRAAGLYLFAAASPFSIAGSQIGLTVAILGWLQAGCPIGSRRLVVPATAFALLTLSAVAFGYDPWASLIDAKALFHLLLIPVAASVEAPMRRRLATVFLGSALLSACFGLAIYLASPGGLEHRARGPFGHYMAFAGVLMLATIVAFAIALHDRDRRTMALLALPFLVGAAASTFARSAWLGIAVGLGVLLLQSRRSAIVLSLAGALLIVVVAPGAMRERFHSIFVPEANADRLEMVRIGQRIIADHPVFGVGPEQVPLAYGRYGGSQGQPHLHNNVLQIAAERGLPALAAWLWLLVAIARPGIGRKPTSVAATAALGATVALFVGGLFEYNFGDSEVGMAFLFIGALGRDDEGQPSLPASRRKKDSFSSSAASSS